MSEPGSRKPLFLRTVERLSELSGYISGLLILASMLVVCYAVLLRYVLGASTIWQTELSIYFLMFAAFVGGAYGLKHGDHVSINLVVDRLPARAQLITRFLAAVLGFLFVVVVGIIAFVLWWETTLDGRRSGTAWNPPLAYPYFIVPLGMTLIALQYVVLVAELFQKLRAGETEEATPDEAEEIIEGGRHL